MPIQPVVFDAVDRSRSRLGVGFVANRVGDSSTLDTATPLVIGAGAQYVTPVIVVTGFNLLTVILAAAGAGNCVLTYIVVDPTDGSTELIETTVGQVANDSVRRQLSWSSPPVHHLIKLKFTGFAGAGTTLQQLIGMWLATV